MSFFSKLIPPSRKGHKNFERGRAAELRADYSKAEAYFTTAAEAFDAHLTLLETEGEEARPSHLVMAGICYTRTGRFEDALRVLDACIERKKIPDAFLNAGYAAAKLGLADRTVAYWQAYPDWAGQRVIANTLTDLVKAIRKQENPDLQGACEAVALAVAKQDKTNQRDRRFRDRGHKHSEFRQGY
ncbi:tetratricopeptide repeat protein [Pseudodesulfovibrio sediminis]|nr:hypothetical protein [Pseudodesulfovibrio sediminis]